MKYDIDYIKLKAKELNYSIINIEEYKNTRSKLKLECNTCNNKISVRADNLLYNRLSNCQHIIQSYYKTFQEKKLTPLEKYINSETKIKLRCHCGNEFYAKPILIKTGQVSSCGCNMRQYNKGSNNNLFKGYKNITGRYWSALKNGAKNRKIDFNITIENAWDQFTKQNGRCIYSGKTLYFAESSKELNNNLQTASLDRIDSNRGYTVDNIQWIDKKINELKFDLSEELFFYYIKRIIERPANNDLYIYESKKQHKNWNGYKDISGSMWYIIKHNAEVRKIHFNITIEDAWNQFIKQNGKCIYTNLMLNFLEPTASLDRTDSDKGYTVDNIQWVHKVINSKMKKSLSNKEFISLCNSIYNFRGL